MLKSVLFIHQNKFKFHFLKLSYSLSFLIISILLSSCLGLTANKRKKKNAVKLAITTARHYTGTKYAWGGTSSQGIDCSGLMYLAWKGAGKKLPRTSKLQSKVGKPVRKKKLTQGDMVFFRSRPRGKKITHVGMVTSAKGNKAKFIHASSSRGVVEDNLWTKYWKKRYLTARRVVF